MSARLRPMEQEDLDAVVEVFLECWRERYAGVLPDAVVTSMTEDRARLIWAPSDADTVVAVDPAVVGVGRYGSDADGQPTVFSLYVGPSAQGAGIGGALLRDAELALAGCGADSAVLWVFAANTASIAFYRKHGWLPDGATRVENHWPAEQIRLSKRITARGAA